MSADKDIQSPSSTLERTETWDRPPPEAEVPGAGFSTTFRSVLRWLAGGSQSAAPDASGLGSRTSTWSAAPDAADVSSSDWSPSAASRSEPCLGERTSTWSSAPDAQPINASDWSTGAQANLADRTSTRDSAPASLAERTSTWGTAPDTQSVSDSDWSHAASGTPATQATLGERTSTWSTAPDAQPVSASDWSPNNAELAANSEQGAAAVNTFAPPSRLQASATEFVPGKHAHGATMSPSQSSESSANAEIRLKPKSALEPVIETDAASGMAAAAPVPENVSSPHRGRELLRASTAPYTTAGSSIESNSPPRLRRVQTIDMGGLAAGLVRPTRSASTEKKQRKFLRATLEHQTEERSSSLPPPPPKPPEASVIPLPGMIDAPHRPANITRKASTEVCAEVRAVVQPAKRVFARDVRRQLRLVVAGLMGSGKSTICRMIAHLLGGVWVNQDEFSHLKKGAKRGFLAEITSVAKDKKVPVLIVDKINTMRQHRMEIVEAMRSGVSGDIVFIQLAHPDDQPGRLARQMQLCLSRIRARGDGHRTLMGNDPKLENILRMTAGGVEAMQQDELELFSAQFTVNMTLRPIESVKQVLADLDHDGFLGRFHIEDLVTQEGLENAFQATQTAEQQLKKTDEHGWSTCGGKKKKSKPAPIWIWVVDYTEDSKSAIRQLWARHSSVAPKLHLNMDFHTTLLYLGGGSDKEIASRHWQLRGPEEVLKLREALQRCEGTDVEVRISNVVWDERIAAAEVCGLEGLCANMHAHVTVALKEGVPPRVSNELLARRDANDDLPANLGHWLSQLGLSQYEALALEWCSASGAASADEIAENAEDIAAAVEVTDEDQQARTRMMFAQAAPGEVCEAPLTETLALRGHVRAKRRGE